jgi:antitoxin component YwqK of YwqJK toxin-antitoxin module
LWIWYWSDQTVRREENYLRGKEDGSSVEYSETGEVVAKGDYIEGLEEGTWFYKTGEITEQGAYKAGLKDGVWKEFYTDGTLKFEGGFVQGSPNGKHKLFFENGKLKEEQNYRMGLRDKSWWIFDTEGNVVISYVYANDALVRINGTRVNLENDLRD